MKNKSIIDYESTENVETIFSSLLELPTLKQMTEQLISAALERCKNISEASKLLGISRQSLSKRIKKR
ncbi:Helix-turn-helix, Fis-type domain protein [Candidatus Magnetomorum sp. HK-1]|nr:Helix-turn-helix, Fis-type domain protein [Candidatus Magnetomorum sp. HK-1]